MISTVLQVALGGAIGASARYLTGIDILKLVGHGFPVAIIAVNVIGSFLMGVFVVGAAIAGSGRAARADKSERGRYAADARGGFVSG